jgi:hypothetical protein
LRSIVLLFGTGGWATGNPSTAFALTGAAPFGTTGGKSNGWTAGGGLEYAITDTILGRIEYRYTDLATSGFVNVPANIADGGSRTPISDFRVGFAYKIRRRLLGAPRAQLLHAETIALSLSLAEHDLIGKPGSTFPDHALTNVAVFIRAGAARQIARLIEDTVSGHVDVSGAIDQPVTGAGYILAVPCVVAPKRLGAAEVARMPRRNGMGMTRCVVFGGFGRADCAGQGKERSGR